MKRQICLAVQALRLRWAGICAWRLYWAQKDHNPHMAAQARQLAEERQQQAEHLEALDAVFPLGYTWTKGGAKA